jgi:hypothetical protein
VLAQERLFAGNCKNICNFHTLITIFCLKKQNRRKAGPALKRRTKCLFALGLALILGCFGWFFAMGDSDGAVVLLANMLVNCRQLVRNAFVTINTACKVS